MPIEPAQELDGCLLAVTLGFQYVRRARRTANRKNTGGPSNQWSHHVRASAAYTTKRTPSRLGLGSCHCKPSTHAPSEESAGRHSGGFRRSGGKPSPAELALYHLVRVMTAIDPKRPCATAAQPAEIGPEAERQFRSSLQAERTSAPDFCTSAPAKPLILLAQPLTKFEKPLVAFCECASPVC